MKEFWDERYAESDYVYGELPNEYLKEKLEEFPSGKILFPCEGEGRNAVFAAKNGWEVFAFDMSTEGRKKAEKLAQKHQAQIEYQVCDALEYQAKPETFDGIVFIYCHFPENIREKILKNLYSFLKPGGFVILEAFNKKQFGKSSGGPNDINMLYNKEIIRSAFEGTTEIELYETTIDLEEGSYHKGPAEVIRAILMKN